MGSSAPLVRTILVDDDIAMLRGLKSIIDWQSEGFEIVGTAENGRDALRLVHSLDVDLMICDITMPGKDGLELTKEAKSVSPGIKSIILTCHDEFPFAREAVAVRADDYLVKYTLTKEELVESLQRVKQDIEVDQASQSRIVQAERALAESRYSLLRRFSHGLLSEPDSDLAASRAAELGLTLPPAKFVAIGFFRASESGEPGFLALEERVSLVEDSVLLPISESFDLMLYWGYHTKAQAAKELAPLFGWATDAAPGRGAASSETSGAGEAAASSETSGAVENAASSETSGAGEAAASSETPPPCITIALADGFGSIGSLAAAAEQLRKLAAGAFYLPYGAVVSELPRVGEPEAWDLFVPVRGDLRTALNTRDQNSAERIIDGLCDEFDRVRPAPEGVRGVVESILIDVGFVANDAKVQFPIDFRSFPRLSGHRAHILETVRSFFAAVEANTTQSPRDDIEKVKAYIDNHLAEPIGLDTICELVFMNKSYLSRLFKQETGETFSEYLMRRRVEKATRLLQSTEKSIDEITEAIGLENVNHFYRIFKKVTGTTPGAFRR